MSTRRSKAKHAIMSIMSKRRKRRDVRGTPLCVYTTYRTKVKPYYVGQQNISDKETKPALSDQNRNAKKRVRGTPGAARKDRLDTFNPIIAPSSLLKTTFARGTIKTNLMAVRAADATFLSASCLEEVRKIVPSFSSEQLGSSRTYRNVTSDPYLIFHQSANRDVVSRVGT